MTICFVYKQYPIDKNFDSGIGKYVYDLVHELRKNNSIVVLTTSKKPRTIHLKNLTIYALPYPQNTKRALVFLRHLTNVVFTLPRIIYKHKIDVIEFANWECEGLFFTLFINRLLKVPTVIRLHTPSFIDLKYNANKKYFSDKLKMFFEKLFVNQKEVYLTTSSNFNAKECRRIYDLDKRRHIEIIPLGVKPKGPLSSTFGHQLLTILYVGRLEKRKGIDMLIKSIPKVLERCKNVRFFIVGRENNNYDWIINLRNTIPPRYLGRVNFLGYISDQKTMEYLYKSSDICVIPSRYESFGLTVLEAMSHGKAIIASKTGGIPEVVTNKRDGLLVEPESVKELSLAIISLYKNEKLRNFLGRNAYNSFKKKFNLDTVVSKTIEHHQSLVKG